MDNKEASYLQEHEVARFMGWDVVTGSGARPCKPGDVISEYFLVECKTHTKEQKNICFKQTHWNKIKTEAMAKHKRPLLVTDNGTQDYRNTWVMVPLNVVKNCSVPKLVEGWNNTSRSGNTVIFPCADSMKLYYAKPEITVTKLFLYNWSDNDQVAILPLMEFKEFYDERFL